MNGHEFLNNYEKEYLTVFPYIFAYWEEEEKSIEGFFRLKVIILSTRKLARFLGGKFHLFNFAKWSPDFPTQDG